MRQIGLKYLFLSCLLFMATGLIDAQDETHYSVGTAGHYGFIIPHSRKIENFAGTKLAGLTIDFRRIDPSHGKWEVFNSWWFWGAEAGIYNYGRQDILGKSFTFSVFAEPVLSHGRNHLLALRGGMGPAILTKLYDPISNPANLFFSSRLSFILHLSARYSYRVGDKLYFIASGNYNHISNGGVKQPNLGMNFPTVSAGLLYYPKSFPVFPGGLKNSIEIRKDIAWTVHSLAGYRVVAASGEFPEKGTVAAGLNLRASKQLTGYYGLNAGAEVIFDGAIKEAVRRSGSGIDYKRAAVTVGQEFLFGKALFTQYFGIYVYSPYKARNSTYQKYEVTFRISGNVVAGFYLKAHAHIAELMGIQFGFRI